MYRSNQTDHSPPSIFHIVNSRHKSTSPAFKFELPSPQPSPNRYVHHLLRETVRRYKSDGHTDGLHKYNLSSQVILHRDCYLRINQDYTENKTTSNPIITIFTFHVPTCSHQTSIFPSRDLLDTCLCFQSCSHPLGTAQKRTIDQTLSVATNLGRHSPFALSSESVCQCRCNAHNPKACSFAKPQQQQQHLLLLSLLSCPSPELVCLLRLPRKSLLTEPGHSNSKRLSIDYQSRLSLHCAIAIAIASNTPCY